MFWKYNNTGSNHVDTLLANPDVTLEELLDEENILQELKNSNKKLVDFLCRPEVMEQLVSYATQEPPADLDEKVRFKYPNIACELLTCDIPSINERLAADEPLSKLYAFLEGEPPLNPLLASFFSKTLGILVARRSEQNWYLYQITCLRVLEFLQSKENCITLLLNHLGTSAVMDLMLKLFTQIEGSDVRQNLINWLETQRVIPQLLALFKPEIDSDRHSNVSQLLSDVIRKFRENLKDSSEPPDPILIALEKQETVADLLDHMLSGEKKSESGIVGGIAVLLTLIETPQARPGADHIFEADSNFQLQVEDVPSVPPVVHSTIAAILPRLKDFHNLLLNPPQKPPVITTVGTLDPPLGNTRLQVARLIAALIATNNPSINQELDNLGTIEVLLDLFFNYQWNNFLHTQVELCIAAALRHQTKALGDGDPPLHCLVENVLIKCNLLTRILNAWEENETNQNVGEKQRRGYMGHLIKIANHVVERIEDCSLKPLLAKQLPPEVLALWEEFVSSKLNETNKKHNIELGGVPPNTSRELDKDEVNFKTVGFEQDSSFQYSDQAYREYQLQEMGPSFVENCGYNDNEFNDPEDTLHSSVDRLPEMPDAPNDDADRQREWFKQVCAKSLRSLEDAEENAWEDSHLGGFRTSENKSRWKKSIVVSGHSSSDEDEDDDESTDEKRELRKSSKGDAQMEVDVNDIWSSGAATLDTIVEFRNPWPNSDSTPVEAEDAFASTDAGWADFSSFETNFSSSTQLDDQKAHESEMFFSDSDPPKSISGDPATEQNQILPENVTFSVEPCSSSEANLEDMKDTDSSKDDPPQADSSMSFVKADANANPTTCADDVTSTATAMVDEVATAAVAAVRVVVADKLGLDNQRFLAAGENDASGKVEAKDEVQEPLASDDTLKDSRDIESGTEDLSSEAV